MRFLFLLVLFSFETSNAQLPYQELAYAKGPDSELVKYNFKLLLLADGIHKTGLYDSTEIKNFLDSFSDFEIRSYKGDFLSLEFSEINFYEIILKNEWESENLKQKLIYVGDSNICRMPVTIVGQRKFVVCFLRGAPVRICGFYHNDLDYFHEALRTSGTIFPGKNGYRKNRKKIIKLINDYCS